MQIAVYMIEFAENVHTSVYLSTFSTPVPVRCVRYLLFVHNTNESISIKNNLGYRYFYD